MVIQGYESTSLHEICFSSPEDEKRQLVNEEGQINTGIEKEQRGGVEPIILDSDSSSNDENSEKCFESKVKSDTDTQNSNKKSSDGNKQTIIKKVNVDAKQSVCELNESRESLEMETIDNESGLNDTQDSEINTSTDCNNTTIETEKSDEHDVKSVTSKISNSNITPRKALSPKQIQKRADIEKEREEKRIERERKKREALEEKLKMQEEKKKLKEEKESQKLQGKLEKQQQKQKEIEEKQKEKEMKEERKRKEREEKEQKRKEKEEREELKRKEKEEREELKRKEKEEKEEQKRKEQEEKQKQEEKKQKAAAAFFNFFTKKSDTSLDEKRADESVVITSSTFMPFEVKSDMKLAPISRNILSDDKKTDLLTALEAQNGKLYLEELKNGKSIAKSGKTWPPEDPEIQDDVIIVEDVNPGESIEEEQPKSNKMRAKFFKFDGNKRPPYFGTWRKHSKFVSARNPFAIDKDHFDYEIDSDEDWEEDNDSGESLRGSDDEDKENDSENEYEVDNEFFVPHGHLSDDELNDEEDAVVSPEAHKAKLKLLKKEFDEERQGKTQKIKPRVIGCIWFNKNQNNVDITIQEFLKPLSVISNGPVIIKKRSDCLLQTPVRRSISSSKPFPLELIPEFLKFIHGNTNNQKNLVSEFLNLLKNKNINVEISKASLVKHLKQFASWTRSTDSGSLRKKYCWFVHKDVRSEYKLDLSLSNP